MVVAIIRQDHDASELRRAAVGCHDTSAARRMLALALVLEDASRGDAARAAGMDRQTLRDWVYRYNAEGLPGLSDRPQLGRTSLLNAEQLAELADLVEAGPNPEVDKVIRWRRVDLQAVIARRFGVKLHERSVGKILRKLKFRKMTVRPQHPKSKPEDQEAFKKSFSNQLITQLMSNTALAGKPIEIWFQDEARIGQQGTLTRVWARRGTRPRAPHDQRRASAYIFGAVCPERGVGAAVVLPFANTAGMNLHLEEISRCVMPGAHAVILLDGAGWHIAKELIIPDNITLFKIPPYSPELNPVENVWQYLRQNKLAIQVWEDYKSIVDSCCNAWNWLISMPHKITSIATRDWAKTVRA